MTIDMFCELDDAAHKFSHLAKAVGELCATITQATHYPKERRYRVIIDGTDPKEFQETVKNSLDYDVVS